MPFVPDSGLVGRAGNYEISIRRLGRAATYLPYFNLNFNYCLVRRKVT